MMADPSAELVIDSFAGGGGASTGIAMALGRCPDIAINHDRFALAMHRANHPETRHMLQDVATVDSVGMCAGQPIGMLWMSPDCTDHSKAKGAAPRRDESKTTRGIGWAIYGWVKALPAWQRPRVIFLENVEEYAEWGPLLEDGRRCPERKGETFKRFVEAFRSAGYDRIEWKQRRAWWSGSGTIRKRLYMVMRRDGEPIVWPDPTHGDPGQPQDAARIVAGELKPWVRVADCIDFSLPIPSIFDTREEIKAQLGLNAKRPLAPKTEARVAKGVMRHVLSRRPFIVKVNHTGRDEARDRGADLPLTSTTAKRDDALVMPLVVGLAHGDSGGRREYPCTDPLTTVQAGGGNQALVTPFVAYAQQGGGLRSAEAPIHTITASAKDQNVLVSPYLVPRYGERPGQEPRSSSVDKPGPTPVPTGNEGSLIAVSLSRQFGASVGSPADEPVGTITAGGGGKAALVCVNMMTMRNSEAPTSPADRPARTLVADGAAETVVATFMAQHSAGSHPGQPSRAADEPMSTLTRIGTQQNVVAVSMMTMRGAERRSASAEEPARTASAGGQHHAVISMPLLSVYYGTDDDGASIDAPSRTETTKPRFALTTALAGVPPFSPEHYAKARRVAEFLRAHGCWDGGEFVTVDVDGVAFVLIDICMRMLTPRERYNANGFPRDYIIDQGIDADGSTIRFTLEQQGHMCGNAVCPTEARDLVAANFRPRQHRRPSKPMGDLPLFLEAAE